MSFVSTWRFDYAQTYKFSWHRTLNVQGFPIYDMRPCLENSFDTVRFVESDERKTAWSRRIKVHKEQFSIFLQILASKIA